MGIPEILFIVALILAIIEEFRARKGQSLISWSVILVCIGLLWGNFVK
jgi:hypothetical protein